eukprot:1195513-Prorocentrum_minimum.AAC.1
MRWLDKVLMVNSTVSVSSPSNVTTGGYAMRTRVIWSRRLRVTIRDEAGRLSTSDDQSRRRH